MTTENDSGMAGKESNEDKMKNEVPVRETEKNVWKKKKKIKKNRKVEIYVQFEKLMTLLLLLQLVAMSTLT